MTDAGQRLREILDNIAKEQDYHHAVVDIKPVSSGGANYTSQLFAITISSPGKKYLKLFSKVAALTEKMRSMRAKMPIFEIEIMFYTKMITQFRELEVASNIPEEERFLLPKYYGGTKEFAQELIVFEDVTAKGFEPLNRFNCFNWQYASACVDSLAKFHALSVAFQRREPETYNKTVGKLKFNNSTETMQLFLKKSVATAIDVTDEKYRERVEVFLQNDLKQQTFFRFSNPERKIFLIHGDFKPSNILHKVDDDGKVQVVLLDYQMIKQGNPVTDLVFFLVCGSDETFRAEHLDHFFNHYYQSFSRSLRQLGISPDTVYKETEYRKDVKEMLPCGLVVAALSLLIVTLEEANAPKPGDSIDINTIHLAIGEQFSVRFNALVRDYVAMGFL